MKSYIKYVKFIVFTFLFFWFCSAIQDAFAVEIPRNWLIWEWLLNWNANDTSWSGLFHNKAIDFNWSNQSLRNTSEHDIWIANSWTIGIWIKPWSDTTYWAGFFELRPILWVANSIWTEANKWELRLGMVSSLGSVIKDYRWAWQYLSWKIQHFVFTWDWEYLKWYKNWSEIIPSSRVVDSTWIMTSTNRRVFSMTNSVNSAYVKWSLSKINIWNTVLSPSEITSLYNSWKWYSIDTRNVNWSYNATSALRHQWALWKDSADIGKDYIDSWGINIASNQQWISSSSVLDFDSIWNDWINNWVTWESDDLSQWRYWNFNWSSSIDLWNWGLVWNSWTISAWANSNLNSWTQKIFHMRPDSWDKNEIRFGLESDWNIPYSFQVLITDALWSSWWFKNYYWSTIQPWDLHHYLATWDWADLKLFLDWKEEIISIKTKDSTIIMTDTARNRQIWKNTAWTGQEWDWKIWNLKIFDRSLSLQEIQSLYQEWKSNTHPVLNSISPQTIDKNNTKSVSFTVSDNENDAISLSASSSNISLVPNSGITFSWTWTSRDAIIVPNSDQVWISTITITASDWETQVSTSFVLTVNDVSDPVLVSPPVTDSNDSFSLILSLLQQIKGYFTWTNSVQTLQVQELKINGNITSDGDICIGQCSWN